MSLGLSRINLVKTVDPRIDIEKLQKHLYAVENCAIQNTYQTFPVSNASPTNIAAVCNPPNRGVFVDPLFFLEVIFVITFNGVSAGDGIALLQCAGLQLTTSPPPVSGTTVGNMYYDAPRAYPLSEAISNVQVTMNNDNNSTNLNVYHRALTRYLNNVDCQDGYESYTPSMLDQFLEYSQGVGTARSELTSYSHNPLQCPRGGFIDCTVQKNTSTGDSDQAVVYLHVMEPMYLSPLSYGCNFKRPAFLQLDTVTLNVNFGGRGTGPLGGLAGALWSHADVSASFPASMITSTSVSIAMAQFNFHYMTPPLSMELPKQIAYPYTQPIYYSTVNTNAIASGAEGIINLQNIQLNSIPQKMYLWVALQDVATDMTKTDTYLEIKKVNITFNNSTGILASASEYDLYNISRRNGFNGSWRQFSNDVGSVVCLQFGEDIPLSSDILAAGTRGSYNFSAQLTVNNNYGTSIVAVASALFIHEGVFVIDSGKCYREVGILTQNEVLDTKKDDHPAVDQPDALAAAGGLSWSEFLGYLKKGTRGAINLAKNIVPNVAPQYNPAVEAVDTLAKTIGIGRKRAGGRKLTKRQLLHMR